MLVSWQSRVHVTVVWLMLFLTVSAISHASERPVRSIAFSCSVSPESPLGKQFLGTLQQALSPLGIHVTLTQIATDKELQLITSGHFDGSCARAANLEQVTGVTGLIGTQSPIYNGKYHIIRKRNAAKLNLSKSRVALLASHQFVMQIVQQQKPESLIPAETEIEIMELLDSDQADMAILWEEGIYQHQALMGEKHIEVEHLFLTLPLFSYLTEANRDVIEILNRRIPMITRKSETQSYQLTPPEKAHPHSIKMVCSMPLQGSTYTQLESLYRAAFNNLGYNLEYHYILRARAVEELKAGRVDSECARTQHFSKITEGQATRVNSIVLTGSIDAFANHNNRQLQGYDDLTGEDRVAFVRGTQMIEDKLVETPVQIVPVTSAEHGLKMLSAGRVDFYVGFNRETQITIDKILLDTPLFNVGLLDDVTAYPFLHKRYQHLAVPLAAELEKIKGQPQDKSR